MIRVLIILLLAIASARAADPPKLPLTSAEQAVSYFRETREHLLAPLPADRRKFVIHVSIVAHGAFARAQAAPCRAVAELAVVIHHHESYAAERPTANELARNV